MGFTGIYPLVNVYMTMENHNVSWENPLFLWSFYSSLFGHNQRVYPSKFKFHERSHEKSPLLTITNHYYNVRPPTYKLV